MKKISFLLVAILLFGCGEKKIDASTEQKLFQSIETIKLSLTNESDVNDIEAFLKILKDRNDVLFLNYHPEIKLADLHGMNADQLLVYYHRYLIAMEQKQNEVARLKKMDLEAIEKRELSELLAEFEQARTNVDKVKVRFLSKESSLGRGVFIEIKNDYNVAIRSVSYSYEFKTEGRSLPWFSGSSSTLMFDGGLEPGEVRRDSLYKMYIDIPARIEAHPEARFNFFVENFTTFDGVVVYTELPPEKKLRLEELLSKY